MASVPMRSHSAPAVLGVLPDLDLIARDFENQFNADNVHGIPVHGIFHPKKGQMLLFYPVGKTYCVAIATDVDVYFKWQDKFTRPFDFNMRPILMCP